MDGWEDGALYPTWEQLVRASALTGMVLGELLRDDDSEAPHHFARCFDAVVAREMRRHYFSSVVAVTVAAHPDRPADAAADEAVREGMEIAFEGELRGIREIGETIERERAEGATGAA